MKNEGRNNSKFPYWVLYSRDFVCLRSGRLVGICSNRPRSIAFTTKENSMGNEIDSLIRLILALKRAKEEEKGVIIDVVS